MKVEGSNYHTIWLKPENEEIVCIIDQTKLPFEFIIKEIISVKQMVNAIESMEVRGAPLIGVAAAYGLYLACLEAEKSKNSFVFIENAAKSMKDSRPTAINLMHAIDRIMSEISPKETGKELTAFVLNKANELKQQEIENSYHIGLNGYKLIAEIAKKKPGEKVNILTHCNAGWLACIDYGTATAPIYEAFKRNIDIHVWVDETRPRNQGAKLTAWELGQQGIAHTIIADNTGGHLMQNGLVDLVIVGSDRTTITGDVANKIGTYLKALAAFDNNIPFYVALPLSTIDQSLTNGIKQIPIEKRDSAELSVMDGLCNNKIEKVEIYPKNSPALNYGFDVTPSRLVSALITERGICDANQKSILNLFNNR